MRFYDRAASFVSVFRKASTPQNRPCIRSTWSASTANSSSRSSRSAWPSRVTVARHPDAVPASVSATPIVAPAAPARACRRVLQEHFTLDDLIDGRRRADVEEHGAGFQRHLRGDGGQRQQLRRGCSRQQRILTQEAGGASPRPATHDRSGEIAAAARRGGAAGRWRGAAEETLRQQHVVRHHRHEVVRRDAEADGRFERTHRAAERRALEHVLEADDRRRNNLGAGAGSVDRGRAALEQEQDVGGGRSRVTQVAAGGVPDLFAGLRDAERVRRLTATRTAESPGRGRRARRSAATRSCRSCARFGCLRRQRPRGGLDHHAIVLGPMAWRRTRGRRSSAQSCRWPTK